MVLILVRLTTNRPDSGAMAAGPRPTKMLRERSRAAVNAATLACFKMPLIDSWMARTFASVTSPWDGLH